MDIKKKNDATENDVFNIRNTAKKFLDNWKLYLLSVIVFVGLGFVFIMAVTPMYKINAEILVQDQDSRSGGSSSASRRRCACRSTSGWR